MRNLKKRFFAAFMVLSLTLSTSSFVFAENDSKIIVSSASASVNEEIDVKVSIEGNSGIAGFVFDLYFDNTKLEPVGIQKGSSFASILSTFEDPNADLKSISKIKIQWDSIAEVKKDGEMFSIKFKVKENADISHTSIILGYNPGNLINSKFEDVNCGITNGDINIISYQYNDDEGSEKLDKLNTLGILKYILSEEFYNLSSEEVAQLDADGDGVITVTDVMILLKKTN